MPRDIKRDMMDYLPRYYEGGFTVGNIVGREAVELAALYAATYDVLSQFYVSTAQWSLERWERICGIATDPTKPDDQRRSVILSKLRGVGTVTPALVKSVAESFDNGEIELTENNAAYTVEIAFVSTLGIPPNIADIQQAIRDILPAHIAVNFVFTYLTWADLDAALLTWGSLDSAAYTWTDFEKADLS